MTELVRKSVSLAFLLGLIYWVFGVLWVTASDTVLAMMVTDPARMTMIQTWKGWLFVAISSGLVMAVANRMLRAVEESDIRYRTMFDGNPEALVLYDPETALVVEVNPAAARLFGYAEAEMRSLPVADLLQADERRRFVSELPRLKETSGDSVWAVTRRDGSALEINAHSQPVTVKDRSLRLVLITDVTAKLRSERELLKALDEVAAANMRMRELGHAISHDLQEPLRQISSFAQLFERRYSGKLGAEADQFIAYSVEGVSRLKSLISDFERFVAPASCDRSLVSVGAIVDQVANDMQVHLEPLDGRIEVNELPTIVADGGKLSVVFHALLENAVKFRATGHACRIRVTSRKDGDEWVFQVRDNGIGLDNIDTADIFALFKRLHTRDRIPGNGTGLALARKLIEAQGGRIWAENVASGGAAFLFALPDLPRLPS